MTRMQLITRAATPDRKVDFSDPNWQAESRKPVPTSAICYLFLEAPQGVFADETFHMTRHSESRGRLRFEIENAVVPMNDEWKDEAPYPYDHVDNCLTGMTVKSEGFDNLLGIGKVLLRRTAMPVSDGMEGFVGAGILLRTSNVPDGVLFDLEVDGSGPFHERSRQPVEDAFPRGGVPRGILERPIWGFGAEGRAFGGTLPLPIATTLDRWTDLMGDAERAPEEEAELEHLSNCEAVRDFYGSAVRHDNEYAAFIEHFRSQPAYATRTKLCDCPTAEEAMIARQGFDETFEAWFQPRNERDPLLRMLRPSLG